MYYCFLPRHAMFVHCRVPPHVRVGMGVGLAYCLFFMGRWIAWLVLVGAFSQVGPKLVSFLNSFCL